MKHHVRVFALTAILVGTSCFVLMRGVSSAPGDLDTTFNGTGFARLGFGQSDDEGFAVAGQADGKLVMVGSSRGGSRTYIEVMRYNVDGSLDTTFGTSGTGKLRLQAFNFGGVGRAVKIQTDGKIVIAGTAFNGNSGTDLD